MNEATTTSGVANLNAGLTSELSQNCEAFGALSFLVLSREQGNMIPI